MIIVNKNGTSLSKAFSDPSTGSDANAPSGPAFEQALRDITAWRQQQKDPIMQTRVGDTWAQQGITDPYADPTLRGQAQQIYDNAQQVKASDPTYVAPWQGDWQNTLAQEKLIQDQLAMANKPDFVVTGPGDVSTGNNDPVPTAPVASGTPNAQPVGATNPASDLDPVLKNIIAWRQEQIDPLMQVRVGDTWAKQGIEDPFNEPHLISQAQEILETAQRRLAMNPGTKAPWDGDWQTALAKDRAAEAQRLAVLADGAAHSNFVVGGKG